MAEDWHKNHPREKKIYSRLRALPATTTEYDITAILGHAWLAFLYCHECGDQQTTAVELGPPDEPYEDIATLVCLDCLKKAVVLAESEELKK